MRLLHPSFSPLQRKSVALFGASLLICVGITVGLNEVQPGHFDGTVYVLLSFIGAVPIVLTMVVIARYLSRETDEYVRSLVTRAILWGFGVAMVADTVLGYLVHFLAGHLSFGVFTMDIFTVTTGIAIRLQLWRNR